MNLENANGCMEAHAWVSSVNFAAWPFRRYHCTAYNDIYIRHVRTSGFHSAGIKASHWSVHSFFGQRG